MEAIEKQLNGVLGEKAPVKLPEAWRKFFVQIAPVAAIIGGVWGLLTVYWMWQWAHAVNNLVNVYNALAGTTAVASRLTTGLWLGIIVLLVVSVMYLAAFPGLRDHKKAGWNLLFYAALLNLVYGVVVLFTDYGATSSFIGTLIGTIIGLWILFQIRGAYTGAKAAPVAPR